MIRGPLGIGKTTVARRLARKLHGTYVSIDRILEEHDLEQWADGYISLESFVRANAFAVEIAAPRLRAGAPVVFDGNFYWKAQLEDLLGRLECPHHVFTLKAPVEVCLARDRDRERPLGPKAVREVYAKASAFDAGTRIDANRALDAVVAAVLAELRWVPRTRTGASRSRRRRAPARGRTSPARPAARSPSTGSPTRRGTVRDSS